MPGRGASGVGRSRSPLHSSFRACGRGPLPTGRGCGGCGHGDPSPNPTAGALASWLCALWGRHEGAQGGRLLHGCGASGVGRSPTPDHSSFRACGRGPSPTGCGCRGCGRGDPSLTPQRALLRAGSARCRGGTRAPGRGRLLPACGAPGVGRCPTPDHSSFRACGRGPLPTGCGCVGCGRGDPSATPQRVLLRAGLARCGGGMRAPGGGASCLGAGRPGSGALPPPTKRPFRPAAGAHYPLAVGAGGAGVGTRHQPRSTRSCELALRAVGPARGCPWGAPLAWVWGVRGRALSHPRPLVLSGVRPGPITHWLWLRGVRAWRTVTNPNLRALASWLCALWGQHEGARGGGRLLPGRPGLGAPPAPSARPLGRAAAVHYPLAVGAGGAGVGTRHQPHSARSCELALRAVGAARGRPGGGASCPGVGRPVSGALPNPTARPLGRAAGAHYPLAVGAGGAGVGTRHLSYSVCSCVLAWRAVGAARGRPGGAPLAWVWGVRGRALSHPRQLVLSGVRPGPTTHWLWVQGVRAWGPVTIPTARALACWLCALWGWHEGVRGGRLVHSSGAPGVGRSPSPDHSSFRACGRGPLPTGRGCGEWGRGDPSPTPPRALLRAGFARRGGGMRVPGGGRLLLGRQGSGGLPTPNASLSAGAAGAHHPLAVGAGGAGVGTCQQPHSSRSCELALRAVGAACGCPGGAPLSAVWGVRGRALSHPPPLVPLGVQPGPTTHWLSVRGMRRGDPSPTPQRALLRAGFARRGGGMRVPGGGRLLLGRQGSGGLPTPNASLSAGAAGAHHPLAVGAGGAGVGTCQQPHSSRSCELALRAVGAACGCPGGAPLSAVWGVRGRALSHPPPLVLLGVQPGPTTHWLSVRGMRRGDPSPTPQRALLRAVFERHEGGTRALRRGASCLGVRRPGTGALPPPTTRPFGRAAVARFPLALGAVCRRGGPAVLGTFSRAAVCRVLCALPGFAAPGGRCGLAPVLVIWLWPAAGLSGVPRGPALARRASSGPVALGAPVGFPVAVMPSPTPGAVAPGFTGWLRAARGGGPRPGLFVPAAGPCRGKGAGRAPRCTRSGPRDGVVPGGSRQLRSRAACAAVVWLCGPGHLRVRFPVPSVFRWGTQSVHRGCFVWTPTPPLSGRRTPRLGPARVCVCVPFLAGSGGPDSRARSGAPHLSFSRFWCALCLFGPLGLGLPCLWLLLGFFFPLSVAPPLSPALRVFQPRGALGLGVLLPSPHFPFFLFLHPRCLWRFLFSGPGCLWPLRPVVPPPPPPFCFFLFFFPSPLPVFFSWFFFFFFFSPVVRCGAGLRVLGCQVCPRVLRWFCPCRCSLCSALSPLWRWLVLCGVACCVWVFAVGPGCPLLSPVGSSCCVSLVLSLSVDVARRPVAWRGVSWCSAALCRVLLRSAVVWYRALPFVCVVACACCLFPAAARLLCVFWGVVLCVPCPLRPVWCCAALCWYPCVVLSASSVLFLVPGVVGSWCRCLFLGVCWWLWLPGVVLWWCVSALVPVSGLAVARRLPCGVLLPCVVSCGAVLQCGALLWCPVFFFCFFIAGGAGFLFPPVFCGAVSRCGAVLPGRAVCCALLRSFLFPINNHFLVEFIEKPKNPVRTGVCGNTQLPHGIKTRIVLTKEHWKCMTVGLPMLGETHIL